MADTGIKNLKKYQKSYPKNKQIFLCNTTPLQFAFYPDHLKYKQQVHQ